MHLITETNVEKLFVTLEGFGKSVEEHDDRIKEVKLQVIDNDELIKQKAKEFK